MGEQINFMWRHNEFMHELYLFMGKLIMSCINTQRDGMKQGKDCAWNLFVCT